MTVNFGNAEIDVSKLLELERMGLSVQAQAGDAEVYIGTVPGNMDNVTLLRALQIVASLRPDEIDVVEGRLRLWWD